MKEYVLWDNVLVQIEDEDWGFLCGFRFHTDEPSYDDVVFEFVTGTGITPNKKHLWDKSSKKFAEICLFRGK